VCVNKTAIILCNMCCCPAHVAVIIPAGIIYHNSVSWVCLIESSDSHVRVSAEFSSVSCHLCLLVLDSITQFYCVTMWSNLSVFYPAGFWTIAQPENTYSNLYSNFPVLKTVAVDSENGDYPL